MISTLLHELGVCYLEGNGVPKNVETAITWFRKSAEQKCSAGQFSLGVMYALGVGVGGSGACRCTTTMAKSLSKVRTALSPDAGD